MDSLRSFINVTLKKKNSQLCNGVRNLIDEKRILETLKSLLKVLTQRNFDMIKYEIVQTIKASPSSSILKSLVCCIFYMAMGDNAYVLYSRLCVELFHALPFFLSARDITTFEKLFLSKCRFELENSSPMPDIPPLVYVEESESHCWKFVKTVRILAQVFKNKMVYDTTRQSIIQVLMNPIVPPERNTVAMNLFLSSTGKLADFPFCDGSFKKQLVQSSQATKIKSKSNEEVRLRKEAVDALARKNEELEMLKRLLESYKEEKGKLQQQTQVLEQGLRLRKETESALAIERKRIEKLKLQLQNLGDEVDSVCLKNEELESKYEGEVILRKESEIALEKERKELEEMKQQLETYKIEMTSQVRTLQDQHNKTKDALSRNKEEVKTVKGLVESYKREANSRREERDNALKSVQELTMKQAEKRELPKSFYCPIRQEVMKEPHFTADGYTYEAEEIRRWFSRGHDTSPMTNLKLPHLNLVPNLALWSAIQEFV